MAAGAERSREEALGAASDPSAPSPFLLCFLIEDEEDILVVVALYLLLSVFLILPHCLGI